jgi:hypothetical protein
VVLADANLLAVAKYLSNCRLVNQTVPWAMGLPVLRVGGVCASETHFGPRCCAVVSCVALCCAMLCRYYVLRHSLHPLKDVGLLCFRGECLLRAGDTCSV